MTIIYFDDNNYPHYKAHIEFLSRMEGEWGLECSQIL